MNKKFNVFISVLFTILLILYVFPNSPDFPTQLPNSVKSNEPADVETTLRRGYYTDLTRSEVLNYYQNEFNKDFKFLGFDISFLAPRLNYPPEEAQTIIRDQTKSTFLEEVVHPFRESIYINGFEPKEEQYAQIYEGVRYKQKIIVRFVPSDKNLRVFLSFLTGLSLYLILNQLKRYRRVN